MDIKKIATRVAGSNGVRALVEDGLVTGIEVDFKGQKFLCDNPCDDEGDDADLDEATAFKMVETTYKGRQDPNRIMRITELGAHPKALSADFEDADGDYVYRAWFLLSDVDNPQDLPKSGEQ